MTDDGRMTDERLATFVWNRDQYDHASWRINAGAATELLDELRAERSRLKATERALGKVLSHGWRCDSHQEWCPYPVEGVCHAGSQACISALVAKEASHG